MKIRILTRTGLLLAFALLLQLGNYSITSAASLKPGDSGPEVQFVQEQLQKMQR